MRYHLNEQTRTHKNHEISTYLYEIENDEVMKMPTSTLFYFKMTALDTNTNQYSLQRVLANDE